jgi:hypothetical protein
LRLRAQCELFVTFRFFNASLTGSASPVTIGPGLFGPPVSRA